MLINLAKEEDQDGLVKYGIPRTFVCSVFCAIPSLFSYRLFTCGRAVKAATILGSGPECGIQITGYRVKREHAVIENDETNTNLFIVPKEGAETRINGKQITERTRLQHHDCVCFGADTLFRVDTRAKCVAVPPSSFACIMLLLHSLYVFALTDLELIVAGRRSPRRHGPLP